MIQFNSSGTHVHKGFLKVRFDLFLDDPASKTYQQQHIQVATESVPKNCFDKDGELIQSKYDAWWAGVPKIWRLNPAICHFVIVPENFALADVAEYVARFFDKDTVATLDNALVQPNSSYLITPFMRTKTPFTDKKVLTSDFVDLIAMANQRLGVLSIPLSIGEAQPLEPGTITIGPGAADGDSTSAADYTYLQLTNPASGTGTITSWSIWANSNLAGCKIGTFYGTAPKYTSRDVELIGDVTSGSKQTFTLDSGGNPIATDVTSGDLAGVYFTSGAIERKLSGLSGFYYLQYDQFGAGEKTYNLSANRGQSIEGSGTETAGGWANIKNIRAGTGTITATDLSSIWFGTTEVAVADIAEIPVGVAV